MALIEHLAGEGGYLPSAGDGCWAGTRGRRGRRVSHQRQAAVACGTGDAAKALDGAAGCGHIPTATWALGVGDRFQCVTYLQVVERGDLPSLRWLLEARCPVGPSPSQPW